MFWWERERESESRLSHNFYLIFTIDNHNNKKVFGWIFYELNRPHKRDILIWSNHYFIPSLINSMWKIEIVFFLSLKFLKSKCVSHQLSPVVTNCHQLFFESHRMPCQQTNKQTTWVSIKINSSENQIFKNNLYYDSIHRVVFLV